MPRCQICNRDFKTKGSFDQHTTDKHNIKEAERLKKERILRHRAKTSERIKKRRLTREKAERDLREYKKKFKNESSPILGIEPIILTHIPIHEEPQEKKKPDLACKTLRNLHR